MTCIIFVATVIFTIFNKARFISFMLYLFLKPGPINICQFIFISCRLTETQINHDVSLEFTHLKKIASLLAVLYDCAPRHDPSHPVHRPTNYKVYL